MSDNGRPKVIPLKVVDTATPRPRDETMRRAVVQVINDLFIERVPDNQRLPFYDAAKELLGGAGWSPGELIDAAAPGPQQDLLFDTLKLAPPPGEAP